MRAAYPATDVRRAEAALAATLPPGTLMDRAAAGIAAIAERLLGRVYGARVVLLVGSGDNGGDALLVGARLARRGARVDAIALGRMHEQAATTYVEAGGRVARVDHWAAVIERADLVVDGIVGIGGSGGLRPDAERVCRLVEAADATILAIDLPSGVEPDTGEVPGAALHADVTAVPGVLKPGLLIDPGASCAGVLELVDIGLQPYLGNPPLIAFDAVDIAHLLPVPGPESDKYRRGVVGVVAGSDDYPGAGVLCAGAAVRSGAGMVRYVGPATATTGVRAAWPEVVAGDGRVQARVIGPGISDPQAVAQHVAHEEPAVLDAACASLHGQARGPLLLTPHAGELATLLGAERADVEARRLHWAREGARRTSAVVLLKGSTTIVAAPDGRVGVNTTGTPWLATAGSGDVLAGIAGTLLAGGLEPFEAGLVAAWLHGRAGLLASRGGPTTSADVLAAVPQAIREVLT